MPLAWQPCAADIVFDAVNRAANHDCVVNRSASFNSRFRRQAARQAQHFGAVRLHQMVSQGPKVRLVSNMQLPSEDGLKASVRQRMVDHCIGPSPELPEGLAMGANEIACDDRRLADLKARPFSSIPYCRAKVQILKSSRCGPWLSLVASSGTA